MTIAVKWSFSVSAVGIRVTDVGVAVVMGSKGFFVAFRYVFERNKVNTEESYFGWADFVSSIQHRTWSFN